MFDPRIEPAISSADVPRLRWVRKLKRRGGGKLAQTTVIRWMLSGLKIGAHRVKLEHIRVGGTLCTSESALSRFFARCADPTADVDAAPKARRQHDQAEAELSRAGI